MKRTPLKRKTPLRSKSPTKKQPAKPSAAKEAKCVMARCDALFSKIVRSRGRCEAAAARTCSRDDYSRLQCAHIISRRYNAVRWDEENALCLCSACHMYFTYHPAEWELFIDEKRGFGAYREMLRRAIADGHKFGRPRLPDLVVLEERLAQALAQTQPLSRDDGVAGMMRRDKG